MVVVGNGSISFSTIINTTDAAILLELVFAILLLILTQSYSSHEKLYHAYEASVICIINNILLHCHSYFILAATYLLSNSC